MPRILRTGMSEMRIVLLVIAAWVGMVLVGSLSTYMVMDVGAGIHSEWYRLRGDIRSPCVNCIDATKPPYNARGDGVHDDTKALQDAADDARRQNKTLYLPPGIYNVRELLDVTDVGITIQGAGKGSTTVRFTGNAQGGK